MMMMDDDDDENDDEDDNDSDVNNDDDDDDDDEYDNECNDNGYHKDVWKAFYGDCFECLFCFISCGEEGKAKHGDTEEH